MMKRATVESTADAYLELLAARGVEYFFANAGTDFAPLIEAYARRSAQGQASPRPVRQSPFRTAPRRARGSRPRMPRERSNRAAVDSTGTATNA